MKKVVAVPIKLNNERFPGKNLQCFFDGKPLVVVALERLARVSGVDGFYVFCSDDAICEYIREPFCFLRRPCALDAPDATPQDIIREFMAAMDADIYMFSHVTSPFVSVGHLNECLAAVACGGYDSAFTAQRIQKLLWRENGAPMNFDPANVPRTQDLAPLYEEVSAAYVFKKETFWTLHRRIGLKPKIVEVSGIEAVDIDMPEDFLMADLAYKMLCDRRGRADGYAMK